MEGRPIANKTGRGAPDGFCDDGEVIRAAVRRKQIGVAAGLEINRAAVVRKDGNDAERADLIQGLNDLWRLIDPAVVAASDSVTDGHPVNAAARITQRIDGKDSGNGSADSAPWRGPEPSPEDRGRNNQKRSEQGRKKPEVRFQQSSGESLGKQENDEIDGRKQSEQARDPGLRSAGETGFSVPARQDESPDQDRHKDDGQGR